MKLIIDRFEGDFAVVEAQSGKVYEMPCALLPAEAVAGSVISITCDSAETEKRRSEMEKKMKSIFGD